MLLIEQLQASSRCGDARDVLYLVPVVQLLD